MPVQRFLPEKNPKNLDLNFCGPACDIEGFFRCNGESSDRVLAHSNGIVAQERSSEGHYEIQLPVGGCCGRSELISLRSSAFFKRLMRALYTAI